MKNSDFAASSLKTFLLESIRRSGPMTFERYMSLCLYHPEFGYYVRGRERTGKEGDYFTSADLDPVFARLIARQGAEMWEILGRPKSFVWVEMGAGRGLFAADFLAWARRERRDFFAALTYTVVEPGEAVRRRLAERLSQVGFSVRLAASLQEIEPLTGCFFSNELVDAFPVAVVARMHGRLREIYVDAEGEALVEKLGPISNPAIAGSVARYAKQMEEGQRVEVNLAGVEWMRAVAERLQRGLVITVDYGDLAERLYAPDRPRGTLLAYSGHTVSEDFYAAPGERDLTAHVNFSALIDAGRERQLDLTGFTTQERFLMALGEANEFADLYDASQNEAQKLRARLKLKRLLNPEGMGNLFKVLIQHRGIEMPVLTGLIFARPLPRAQRQSSRRR